SPMTVVVTIVGAVAAAATLSWLFGASGSSGNAMTNGNLPDLGGTPPPPPLNRAQMNGGTAQAPAGNCPAPSLENILCNAGYSQEEQRAQLRPRDYEREGARPRTARVRGAAQPSANQQAALRVQEGPRLPQCPDEIFVLVPDLPELEGRFQPSQTRGMLNNGNVPNWCEGTPPQASVRPVVGEEHRFRCRDTATGSIVRDCAENGHNHACPPGQALEECPDLRLSAWSSSITSACVKANAFGKKAAIVIEGVNLPQDSGTPPTPEEQTAFNDDIEHLCTKNMKIYSEDPPFQGASARTRTNVHFRARSRDVFQGRGSESGAQPLPTRNAEPATDAAQDAEQNQSQEQDEAQGATSSGSSSDPNRPEGRTKPRFPKK
ncbi:MAG: hypothetical protein ACRC7P_08780, partial [Enterovibrio sp.]